MDISKAAGAAAGANPAGEAGKAGKVGETGGAGGAERRFADVLGGQGGQGLHHPQSATQFSAPILDPGLDGRLKPAGVGHDRQPHEVSRRATIELVGERAGTQPAGVNAPEAAGPSWQKIVQDTSKAESRMDAMIQAARNGKSFSASELLALQVEVFRYSQTVEVISKSSDKLVGAVKQTLGTQV
jgi:hypothetical protein